jgi:MFS transporter, DHA2 family, multidrug resistance protein
MTMSADMTDDSAELYPRRWWTLGVLCLSLLIIFVGNSSLNVALPTLSRDLGASTSQLQWVVAAYSLVFAGLLFTAGALGDRFGRKGALQLGLAGFLVGAVLASAATSVGQLIACRALMGGCAAFIMPSTLSVLVNTFPPQERARAIAIWAGVTGGAGAIGPIASGWLLGRFWFGSVFLVNVPIIVAALILGMFLVPSSKDPQQAKLDPVGAGLSILGISSFVFGLIQAPDKGWTSTQTLGAFALGAAAIVGFVLWERARTEPMLDLKYFRNPAFSTATGGMILVFMSMFGVMFLITQYFQLILGFSALSAALRLLPMAPIMMIVSMQTPRIIARLGHNRTVAMGMLLLASGFLLFAQLRIHTGYPYILLSLACLTSGISLTMSPMTAAIMSAVPARRAGAGSAMNDATRELGAALGIAVLGSVASSRYASGLRASVAALSPADQSTVRTSLAGALDTAHRLPPDVAARLVSGAEHAFVGGIHLAAYVGATLAATASLMVMRFLPSHIQHHGGGDRTAIESLEDVAELGLGGVPPIYADTASGTADLTVLCGSP